MTFSISLADCLCDATERLSAAGIASARREARLLMAHWLGCDPVTLIGDTSRAIREPEPFFDLVSRRERREPLSHILGRREFWSLDFQVTADVLDPRPDSETLVEAFCEAHPDRMEPLRILDLGTGSGCLLLTVLHERPRATGVGVDISFEALTVAARNAEALELANRTDFLRAVWGTALSGRFDAVLVNPPYIAARDIDGLEPEVAMHEPRLALDGGPDGLDCYRRLASDLARLLSPNGVAVIEIGKGQDDAVAAILSAVEMIVVERRCDLSGTVRCLVAKRIKAV